MRPKYLLENRECFLPCGRKTVVAKGVGGNMKQTEKSFLKNFQRPASHSRVFKTTLTPGRAIRQTCSQCSNADIVSYVSSH